MRNPFQRPSRTAARAACAAVALVAAMLGAASDGRAANNIGLPTIPLVIKNNSGLAPLFVLVTGQVAGSGTYYYVTAANGNVATFPKAPSGGTLPYKPYGLSLGKTKVARLNVPQLYNVRVYVSLGRKMWFNSDQNGNPSTPAGWDSTDKNYNILYDWAEFSWVGVAPPSPFTTSLNGNLTQVDMLGLPMLMRFSGQNANQKKVVTSAGFAAPGSRAAIMTAFAKAGLPWSKLVVNPRAKVPLRVNSPYNGMKNGTFPTNQLTGYINQVFSTYATKTMVANTNADGVNATFNGKVTGGSLVFTQTGAGNGGNTVTFVKPTSNQAYSGYQGTVPSGASQLLTDQAAQIGTFVQAGFMRGTMLTQSTISNCPGPAAYYKNAPVNMYAKIMHLYAYQHQAYGFGYDDVCGQSSDETVFNPTGIQLTIQPVTAPKPRARAPKPKGKRT